MKAFFFVALYVLNLTAESSPDKVNLERLPELHLAAVAETNSAPSKRKSGSFDERQQDRTQVREKFEEERGCITLKSKVFDSIGKLAMKLKLNPRVVYMLSRAGVDVDRNAWFDRWLQYVNMYRAWKGGSKYFTDSAIYNLVKSEKTDAELLNLIQSTRRSAELLTTKQLADHIFTHAFEAFAKTDWLVARKSPREIFYLLGLENDVMVNMVDVIPVVWWLKYINMYNKVDGSEKFTGQDLYDLLSITNSDTNVAKISVFFRQDPEFKKIGQGLQDTLVSNPASKQTMYDVWLEFATSPQQVFNALQLVDKLDPNEGLLTEWFRYVNMFWSGPEGKARQIKFRDTDCIGLLRRTHSNQKLRAIFSSLRQDPSMKSFADVMLTHVGFDKQSDEWLAARVSPAEAFSLLKLDSEDDPDNIKLYQLLTYVNEYGAKGEAAKGKHAEFTEENLYHLLQERQTPTDPVRLVESLRQDQDMKNLAERMQAYMVTNPETRRQVYEAWLTSSTTPQQALEILRTGHGRAKYLFGKWLGYVKYYWSGPEGVARQSDFSYDDCIDIMRSKLGSDEALEELLDLIRPQSNMENIANDLLVYLKISQHTKHLLEMGMTPLEAYRLLQAASGNAPNDYQLRQWLSFVDAYRGVEGNAATREVITDEELFEMLKQMKASPDEMVSLIEWLLTFPYMKKIAQSMKELMISDDLSAPWELESWY